MVCPAFVNDDACTFLDTKMLSSRSHKAKSGISVWQVMEGLSWLEALISGPHLVCSCNIRDCSEYVAI